ncbi:hypothetical protein DYBT9623_03951 [Dyadobacter sp. CECT 9623]|uniref:Capsule assembly protein Wzi n=1 Tax=Dyadobacter linearis TaxID=2823330 RepID=A0ABM8UUE7_9BACT|nr:capsule assembly Wzi family protein [Dyadobacter sp. CECT 9623]CAG5072011.1 hypothetical protein DYBT9623_03951 [Dyadobacter sp. CECT 9623]
MSCLKKCIFSGSRLAVVPLLISHCAFSQTSLTHVDSTERRGTYYYTELGIIASSARNTPFWLHANRFGIAPTRNPVVLAGVGLSSDYHEKKWDVGYGIQAWASLGRETRVIIPEAFVKAKFRSFEIWGGRRKQIMGIVGDTALTSGSYIQSGNSIPIPQIQIGFINYTPLFKGVISFKALLTHGWFGSNPVVKNHYLHQKAAYIKVGKPKWPVRVAAGFNHNVQWGGKVVMPNQYTVGKEYPSEWIDYWYVFSGKRIPTFGFVDPDKYDAIDRGNRVGNHLGSLDFSIEATLPGAELIVYRQFLYDDGSLYYRKGFKDGLNGVSLKFNKSNLGNFRISGVTAEFLYTVDQGGGEFTLDGGPRGRDDYFNHTQYTGWVYNGNTVGTPFITPKEQTSESLPRNSAFRYSNNTRVKLFHIGFSGQLDRVLFLCKISYSENQGTYEKPFPRGSNQFSLCITSTIPVKTILLGKVDLRVMLASDAGKLYRNTTGAHVSLIKNGLISR